MTPNQILTEARHLLSSDKARDAYQLIYVACRDRLINVDEFSEFVSDASVLLAIEQHSAPMQHHCAHDAGENEACPAHGSPLSVETQPADVDSVIILGSD